MMTRMVIISVGFAMSHIVANAAASPSGAITVPDVFYAVEGVPTSLNARNFVWVDPDKALEVEVDCDVGQLDGEVWRLVANDNEVGDHAFTIRISRAEEELALSASFTVRVIPKSAGEGDAATILIIGDSLTNASRYPNELARLLDEPGNPDWKMMGTHHPKSAAKRVFHEGYGGWTWARFNTRYEPKENQVGKTRTSPFVFLSESGEPELNVARYFSEYQESELPDFVFLLLGINDCFHPDPEDPVAIDERIDLMMVQAEIFLASLKEAVPGAKIGIGLTPAPNDREGAFVANYGKRYTRDGWRKIQFRLVQRQLDAFSERQSDGIYAVPTAHSIHPHFGYPDDNAVHPNEVGSGEIGKNVYAWIKAVLAEN